MPGLQTALPPLRARIARSLGKRDMNEENTKATLVEPVLKALGWDTEDIEEVAREHKGRRSDKPVDYALLVLGSPRLYVEVKALGANLEDRKWASQIMGYAGVAGVEWIVLTNGDEWRIYNAHAAVRIEEKLFRTVRISEAGTFAEETLTLLSKDQLAGNRIEVLWRSQYVDRKVQGAIEGMFGTEPDPSILKSIRRRTRGLSPKDIRSSLRRAHIVLEFPPLAKASHTGGSKRPEPITRKPSSKSAAITQHDLLRAGIVKAPLVLERTYKGQKLRATLGIDGRIVHRREAFDTLSAAGLGAMQAVRGGTKPLACNGWAFWCYRDKDGKLVPVDMLRQEYLRRANHR